MPTIPAPTITLNKNSYPEGEVMRLRCRESITARRTWTVTDSQQVWSLDAGAGTTDYTNFTSVAQHPAKDHVVHVRLTRTSDGATSTSQLAYDVAPSQTGGGGGGGGLLRMGVSLSDEDHQLPVYQSDGHTPSWRTGHAYNWDKARSGTQGVPHFHMESICLSDSNRWDAYGGNNVLTGAQVDTIMGDIESFHNDFPNVIIRYSWGNEVDRHVSNHSNFNTSVGKLKTAMQATWPAGYGNWITMWVSFTGNCFRPKDGNPPEINQFDGLGPHLYGLGANIYPQGRDDNPVVATAYADFVDPVVAKCRSWGVRNYACWETGIPVPSGSRTTYPNNGKTRPQYMAGMRDYAVAKMQAAGITTTELCYWDANLHADNRLFQDGDRTAKAWVNWR